MTRSIHNLPYYYNTWYCVQCVKSRNKSSDKSSDSSAKMDAMMERMAKMMDRIDSIESNLVSKDSLKESLQVFEKKWKTW